MRGLRIFNLCVLFAQAAASGCEPETASGGDLAWKIVLVIVLVLAGGVFAGICLVLLEVPSLKRLFFIGLTIGLMSLDPISLEVFKSSGTAKQKKYAARLEPIRKNGHLLLVTLQLASTAINESLPIVMDTILPGGWQSILISVFAILIFGEYVTWNSHLKYSYYSSDRVIPQALCTRFGLAIGAHLAWSASFLAYERHLLTHMFQASATDDRYLFSYRMATCKIIGLFAWAQSWSHVSKDRT